MHFLWSMHLFILVLFSLFSMDTANDFLPDLYDENEHTTIIIIPSTTIASLESDEQSEGHEDYIHNIIVADTTTPFKKVTKHHAHHHDHDDLDYYDQSDHESEEEKATSTKSIITTSSSSTMKLITGSIKETTTTEIPTITHLSWSFSDSDEEVLTTTVDPKQIALFLAKSNRDRLFLKIFAITVIAGMFSLAVALISIHFVRKARRYRGYDAPANNSANKQSMRV